MTSVNEHNDARAEYSSFEHVSVLLAHMRLEWLLKHFPPRLVWGCLCLRKRLRHHRIARLAGPSYWQPVCLSIARSDCVSVLLFPASGSFQPAQYHPRARYRTDLWLCRLRNYGSLQAAFWRASRCPRPKSAGRCAFAFSYGRAHGSVPGKPSACGSDDPHRFARYHFPTQGARHHRGRRDPAYGASSRNQSARRHPLPSLEISQVPRNALVVWE
jgi:hypothetical protein